MEALYYGNLNPVETLGKRRGEWRTLTNELQGAFEQLMVDRLECEDMERYQVYGDGFITGVRLMIEIFTERKRAATVGSGGGRHWKKRVSRMRGLRAFANAAKAVAVVSQMVTFP